MINPDDTSCPKCKAYKAIGATFCMECGFGRIEDTPKFCTTCGLKLDTGTTSCPSCAKTATEDALPGRCPKCGVEIHAGAGTCPNCGVRISEGDSILSPAIEPEGTPVCRNCGAVNNPEHNFCIFCGAKLTLGQRVPLFCPRCGCRRGKERDACPACGEIF